MFKFQKRRILSGLIIFIVLNAPVSGWAISEGIVAVVGEEVITLKDVREYVEGIYQQLKIEGRSSKEINEVMGQYEKNGVNQLIEDKLILEEANRQDLEVRPDFINKRLDEIKKNYKSEKEFLDAIVSVGMSVTDLRQKIINQMKAKFLVDKEVHSKIFVNPQEVTDYYNKHVQDFTQKERINLDSIFISFEKGKDNAIVKAKGAKELLDSGKDFSAVAKEYSQSPSIGVVERGQMISKVDDAIFSLKTGEISPIIEVDGGVYIFRVSGRLPFNVSSLQEAKTKIYNRIFQEKFKGRFSQWIDKLRKKTYVEIKQ